MLFEILGPTIACTVSLFVPYDSLSGHDTQVHSRVSGERRIRNIAPCEVGVLIVHGIGKFQRYVHSHSESGNVRFRNVDQRTLALDSLQKEVS